MTISPIIDQLINEIAILQTKGDSGKWKNGIFPHFRRNDKFNYFRNDNSIFYNASIVYTLNNIIENLSENSKIKVKNITDDTVKNYSDFMNPTNNLTYNFYPTNPSEHFGNGNIFKHFKHFQLPDDADDTALIYMTSDFTREQHINLQKKLAIHSNGRSANIVNTIDHYKSLKAYSTWFGKNMAIEFDVCVLCNILKCQLDAGLELDEHGLDSWKYIKGIILSQEYITDAFVVSHNYAEPVIILYHLARLLETHILPDDRELRLKIGYDIIKKLEGSKREFKIQNILLSTTLKRLGLACPLMLPNKIDMDEQVSFSFFRAGLLSPYEHPILRRYAALPFTRINWSCPAHTLTLMVENLAIHTNDY